MIKIVLAVIVVLLLSVGAYYLLTSGQTQVPFLSQPVVPKEEKVDFESVIANNNAFEPNSFRIAHTKSLILNISAQDQDYVFVSKDFEVNQALPKGQTTKIKLNALSAPGIYTFSCGQSCSGTVEIYSDDDDDEGTQP